MSCAAARVKCRAPQPAREFVLAQSGDHLGFQPAPRLRVDRGMDGLMADQAGGIVGVHGPEFARNLLWGPAPVDQLSPHPVMEPIAANQLMPTPAPLGARARYRSPPSCAIRVRGLSLRTASPQFPPDRRGAAPQQQADRPKARPAPVFRDLSITSPKALIETGFATGNSLCKAILCLLAFEQPRNFHNDGIVPLDNSYLKIASSKNYHHFFPKDHLRKLGIGNENSVVNITLISADLNKRQISARPPMHYIPYFEKNNAQLSDTLRTHLIDRHGMGIDEDDYGSFLAQRADRIWSMITVRIYPNLSFPEVSSAVPASRS